MIDFSAEITDLDGAAQWRIAAQEQESPATWAKSRQVPAVVTSMAGRMPPGQMVSQVPVTLAWLCRNVLNTEQTTDQAPGKLARIALANRIPRDGGPLDLSPEETTLLKNRVLAFYPAITAWRVLELIDPKSLPAAG
jgi:hypothetical protein